MQDQISTIEARVTNIEASMKANTEKIDSIYRDTAGIVETFKALDGGLKVLQGIGRLAKPVGWIAASCTAVAVAWGKFKGGA